METVRKTLEMPANTLEALERLAKITGAKAGAAEVIQDALRVYEWAVYNQANGNVIVASAPLTDAELKAFDQSSGGVVHVLEPLFDESEKDEALRFFRAA